MARQIVVSGGAGFWSGDDGVALDRFALSLTGKHRQRDCFPGLMNSLADTGGGTEQLRDGKPPCSAHS